MALVLSKMLQFQRDGISFSSMLESTLLILVAVLVLALAQVFLSLQTKSQFQQSIAISKDDPVQENYTSQVH
jgi:hypothetical protein